MVSSMTRWWLCGPIGDLERGERFLHKATRRSAIVLTIVGAAVLVSLYVYVVVVTRVR